MKKTEFDSLFRECARNTLSPTKEEQNLILRIYDAFKNALGQNCLLIGSFARYTAIRPLHDLDILYVAGQFNPENINPQSILAKLKEIVENNFRNPTNYQVDISIQSHSITIIFLEKGKEKFSADVVPAFISGLKNEFGDDIYWVPEIVNLGQHRRRLAYEEFVRNKRNELDWWIKSDPKGYIQLATNINTANDDFRRVVKFIKKWKHSCAQENESFKLKSFHIEQSIVSIFQQDSTLGMFDAIFRFFCNIPEIISGPQIKDRADKSKFIDSYLEELTAEHRKKIIEGRDHFLISLENFDGSQSATTLLEADFYKRACVEEAYLFDFGIRTLIEPGRYLKIDGFVDKKNGGFREYWLSEKGGRVNIGRKIWFKLKDGTSYADLHKWKVKNDNNSFNPNGEGVSLRGEITDSSTRNNPESTAYLGNHYVECYATRNGICVAKSKQDVIIER